jgi:hypothetical protein
MAEPTELQGIYGVQDLGGYGVIVDLPSGQRSRVHLLAYLELDDGTVVALDNRPAAEMKALEGKRVAATGTFVPPVDPPVEEAAPPRARPDPMARLVHIDAVHPL